MNRTAFPRLEIAWCDPRFLRVPDHALSGSQPPPEPCRNPRRWRGVHGAAFVPGPPPARKPRMPGAKGVLFVLIALFFAIRCARVEMVVLFAIAFLFLLLNRGFSHPMLSTAGYEQMIAARVRRAAEGYRNKEALSLLEGAGIVLFFFFFGNLDLVLATAGTLALCLLLWYLDCFRGLVDEYRDRLAPEGDWAGPLQRFFGDEWKGLGLALFVSYVTCFVLLHEISFLSKAEHGVAVRLGVPLCVISVCWLLPLCYAGQERMKVLRCSFAASCVCLGLSPVIAGLWLGPRLGSGWIFADSRWELVGAAALVSSFLGRELWPALSRSGERAEGQAGNAASLMAFTAIAVPFISLLSSVGMFPYLLVLLGAVLPFLVGIFLLLSRRPTGTPPRWALAVLTVAALPLFLLCALAGLQGSAGFSLAMVGCMLLPFIVTWPAEE